MPHILVTIPADGMIRCEAIQYNEKKIVHKQTIGLDKLDGIRVFDKLVVAKEMWQGPESDEAILTLNENGGGDAIWMADSQRNKLASRISKWKGCYGGWTIKRLNA